MCSHDHVRFPNFTSTNPATLVKYIVRQPIVQGTVGLSLAFMTSFAGLFIPHLIFCTFQVQKVQKKSNTTCMPTSDSEFDHIFRSFWHLVFTALRHASVIYATAVCLSICLCVCVCVCLSQVGVLLRQLSGLCWCLACMLSFTYPTLCYKVIRVSPKIKVLPRDFVQNAGL